jgi:phosphatidylserine/phosphatidylglycerophosphate/cardiolipin synthase-like enzyme
MTSQRVADEYCRLAANGVIVKVILDKSQTLSIDKEQTLIDQMRRAGIEVLVTTSPDHHALMHSKFSIADHAYVIDGSWNYTDSADEQCNVLTFNQSRSPERAAPYIEAWNNLYSYAKASTSVSTIDQDLRLMQMAKGSAHGKHKRQSAHQHLRLSRD